MIAKIKKQALFLVALYLGYSGYGAMQPDEEAALKLGVPEVLPEILDEDMPLRSALEEVQRVADPFHLGELNLKPMSVNDDENPVVDETGDDGATILELESTMRLPDGPIAFINKRRIGIGQNIVDLRDGPSPVLKSVRGPQVEIEYMDQVYVLDIHNMSRLQLGQSAGKLLRAAKVEESTAEPTAGNSANRTTASAPAADS
ncbi:MAG: hypothetical protein H8E15_12990 [Planctomycetes bacterium]|nr:hypothetical protein [Planctomycetota bacterium]